MSRKLWISALGVLALTASAVSQASLMGATVTTTNSAAPQFGGTFVVGDAIEQSLCLIQLADSCLLGTELDYGSDYISYHSFNRTFADFAVSATTLQHTFDDSVSIADAQVVSSIGPINFALSFTERTVTYLVDPYVWAAQSDYSNRVAIRTVPEPGTLALWSLGLLGVFAAGWSRRAKG
jgi:hypothetical protein